MLLPFEWSEVTLVASGARELRVRASVERSGEGSAGEAALADGSGQAVARVGGLRLRERAKRRSARRRAARRSICTGWSGVRWR